MSDILFSANIELQRFKNNKTAQENYRNGIQTLFQSGIFHLLRSFARPVVGDGGANPNKAVYQCAIAEGYNQALDDLLYFEQTWLSERVDKKPPVADFGGIRIALAKGDLKESDLNGRK